MGFWVVCQPKLAGPSSSLNTMASIPTFTSNHRIEPWSSIFRLTYTRFTMHIQSLLISLLAAAPASADNRCDAHLEFEPSPTINPGNDTTTALKYLQRLTKRQTAPAPPAVPLYVHIVAGTKSRQDGYLTDAEVTRQVSIITSLFAPHGITFTHTPSTMRLWTVNASWAGPDRDNFNEMKESLHKGDYRTLNLYIRNITLKDYGGTCTNPWTQEERTGTPFPARLLRDGCIINTETLDGSAHPYMNQGKTAVHEIGHWFGLHHTFEDQGVRNPPNPPNPCWEGNPDDDVLDTPKMRDVGAGVCNKTQNSCPEPSGTAPVYDPVENYMAYSSDACMERFTSGQKERMWAIYDKYRKNETRG